MYTVSCATSSLLPSAPLAAPLAVSAGPALGGFAATVASAANCAGVKTTPSPAPLLEALALMEVG